MNFLFLTKKLWVMLLTLMILILIFGCGQPENEGGNGQEPGEEALQEQQKQEESNGEPVIKNETQIRVTGDNLAVRKTPGTKDKPAGDVLQRVNRGDVLFLQDQHDNQVFIDGYIWWEVYEPSSQIRGWAAEKYLDILQTDTTSEGAIEGSITFPGEAIPSGFVVTAENIATGETIVTQEIIYDNKYSTGVGFKINVSPGNYYLYASEPQAPHFKAYYDEHMKSSLQVESFEPVVVSITEGQHVDNVLVGNWWREEYTGGS